MDEIYHEDYGYGYYVDTELDVIYNNQYKKNEITVTIYKTNDINECRMGAASYITHAIYIFTIGLLCYSWLFKKL
jgi:hypothetical protein